MSGSVLAAVLVLVAVVVLGAAVAMWALLAATTMADREWERLTGIEDEEP